MTFGAGANLVGGASAASSAGNRNSDEEDELNGSSEDSGESVAPLPSQHTVICVDTEQHVNCIYMYVYIYICTVLSTFSGAMRCRKKVRKEEEHTCTCIGCACFPMCKDIHTGHVHVYIQ